jgi:Flp pilus assembly protein TadD
VEQPYLLPEAVLAHLKNAYPEHALRDRRAGLGARAEDYAEYLRLYEEFDLRRGESLSTDEILARLAALHRRSPRFLEPLILQGYILQQRYRYGRRPEDLQNLFEGVRQARLLAPDDPRPLFSLYEAALLANQLDRAEEALRQLERLQPGDTRLLALRARLLDRQGQSQRALSLMQSAVQRMPSWHHLFWLADMEYRLGKVQDARAHLHALLDRSPGNYMGESLLGQLELYNGAPQRAEEIYGRLARRSPQYGELGNLGLAQFMSGHFGEAEKSYRQAVALQPRNPLAILNLADACLLSGREREARSFYTQVLQLAEQDPSAGSDWQLSSVRAQSLAHLGRKDEAIAAVQKALQLAPDNPQAAYEASLVYVLLGDGNSARFNARRALEQGVGPRWFSFPWFAPLREDPELRDLLRPGSQSL